MHIFRTPTKNFVQGKMQTVCQLYFEKPDVEKQPLDLFYKKGFSKVSQNSQKNIGVGVSFSIKLQVSGSNFIKKENQFQEFFCEFCEKLLKKFFTEYIRATAFRCVIF